MGSNKTWKQSNLDAWCGDLLTGSPAANGSTGRLGSDLSWVVAERLEGGELVQSHQVATVTVGVAEHKWSRLVEASAIIRARGLSSLSEVGSLDGSDDLGSSLVVSCGGVARSPETSHGSTLTGHDVTTVRVVDEVAPGAVGTVATDPVLLAELGLVLVVPDHVLPELMLPMGKLTQLSVEAGSLLLEVATDLGLEPGIGIAG